MSYDKWREGFKDAEQAARTSFGLLEFWRAKAVAGDVILGQVREMIVKAEFADSDKFQLQRRISFHLNNWQKDQGHDLYKQSDVNAPNQIKGVNGDIILRMCKRCGRIEGQLKDPCEVKE